MKLNLDLLEELFKDPDQREWNHAIREAFPSLLHTIRIYEQGINKLKNMDIEYIPTPDSPVDADSMEFTKDLFKQQRDFILQELEEELKK